jgi:hypothetical protein
MSDEAKVRGEKLHIYLKITQPTNLNPVSLATLFRLNLRREDASPFGIK